MAVLLEIYLKIVHYWTLCMILYKKLSLTENLCLFTTVSYMIYCMIQYDTVHPVI